MKGKINDIKQSVQNNSEYYTLNIDVTVNKERFKQILDLSKAGEIEVSIRKNA